MRISRVSFISCAVVVGIPKLHGSIANNDVRHFDYQKFLVLHVCKNKNGNFVGALLNAYVNVCKFAKLGACYATSPRCSMVIFG